MNKYKLFLILFLFITILSISKVYALINGYDLIGKVIYIDPGHGGVDSGTTYQKIYEKDLNFLLSKKLAKDLASYGATVYLTRETDKDLALTKKNRKRSDLINRAYLINKTKPDIYISIHLNYLSDSRYKGLQIFYNNKNEENKQIADSLTQYIKEKTVNVREPKYNNTYYMYRNINTPGVLIELGFLSNPDDRYRLTHTEYQDKLISNLTYAIKKYYQEKSKKSFFFMHFMIYS